MTNYTARFLAGRRRNRMSEEELAVLESAIQAVHTVPARKIVVHKGDEVPNCTLLVDGFMCRYLDDREGYRQLVCVHVPGDFVDLHAFPLEKLDHDVATITTSTIATVPRETMKGLVADHPHLARMLWFSTLLDAAMHREWIFRLGRLGALGRVAHFFCETHAKLKAVGLADSGRFSLPLTQLDIAEACGLTPVHVNRVLRQLRERGLLQFREKQAMILDERQLVAVAEFDPEYLYLEE